MIVVVDGSPINNDMVFQDQYNVSVMCRDDGVKVWNVSLDEYGLEVEMDADHVYAIVAPMKERLFVVGYTRSVNYTYVGKVVDLRSGGERVFGINQTGQTSHSGMGYSYDCGYVCGVVLFGC